MDITPTLDLTLQASSPQIATTEAPPDEAVPATEDDTGAQAADPLQDLPRITDPRQIRILLLGIDQRSETGETGPFRTDTMILLNIDPVRKTVGVLSLPRDLWVNIPNFDPGRINMWQTSSGMPMPIRGAVVQRWRWKLSRQILVYGSINTCQ